MIQKAGAALHAKPGEGKRSIGVCVGGRLLPGPPPRKKQRSGPRAQPRGLFRQKGSFLGSIVHVRAPRS